MTMKRSHSAESNLCRFSFSDGRRCRMLVHSSPRGLCPFHAREEMQIIESRRLGSELSASLTGHFHTAADINHVLGKIFTALAQNRITPRTATVLAYIGQLLLQSIPAVKAETQFKYSYDSWSRMIDKAIPISDPPDNPAHANSSAVPNATTPNTQQAKAAKTQPADAPPTARATATPGTNQHSVPLNEGFEAADLSEIEEPQPV
jgi:hypothetical protein